MQPSRMVQEMVGEAGNFQLGADYYSSVPLPHTFTPTMILHERDVLIELQPLHEGAFTFT